MVEWSSLHDLICHSEYTLSMIRLKIFFHVPVRVWTQDLLSDNMTHGRRNLELCTHKYQTCTIRSDGRRSWGRHHPLWYQGDTYTHNQSGSGTLEILTQSHWPWEILTLNFVTKKSIASWEWPMICLSYPEASQWLEHKGSPLPPAKNMHDASLCMSCMYKYGYDCMCLYVCFYY